MIDDTSVRIIQGAMAEVRRLEGKIARMKSPWISVDERLPKKTMWLLVNADGAVNCAAFNAETQEWEDWTRPSNPNVLPQYITHWMPIPEPPAAQDDEEDES